MPLNLSSEVANSLSVFAGVPCTFAVISHSLLFAVLGLGNCMQSKKVKTELRLHGDKL